MGCTSPCELIESASVSPTFRLTKTGVLQHRRALPEAMQDVLVLDAGAAVDELMKLDDEIALATDLPYFDGIDPSAIRDWSTVDALAPDAFASIPVEEALLRAQLAIMIAESSRRAGEGSKGSAAESLARSGMDS